MKGFVARDTKDAIYIEPSSDNRDEEPDLPIIPEGNSLLEIKNKNQIVQKFFKLKHYSPSQMARVIMPLVSESGYVSTNKENTGLLVIDTVKNLITIERIISQFDVSSEPQNREIIMVFEVQYKDPSEIIKSLRTLINDQTSGDSSMPALTETGKRRIMLVPEQKHHQIIARASSEDMNVIRKWIEKLDSREPDANVMPESWSLYYDDGLMPDGGI